MPGTHERNTDGLITMHTIRARKPQKKWMKSSNAW